MANQQYSHNTALDDGVVTWNEVSEKPATFTPSSHTHNSINTVPIADFDGVPQGVGGFYESNQGSALSTPLASQWHLLISAVHTNLTTGARYAMQLATPFLNTQRLFFRNIQASANNTPWHEILHSGNYVESWQIVTPSSSKFSQHGTSGNNEQLAYRKNNVNNSIEFKGVLNTQDPNMVVGTYYLMFTLPAGRRPAKVRSFPLLCNHGGANDIFTYAVVSVNQLGEVYYMKLVDNGQQSYRLHFEFSMPL